MIFILVLITIALMAGVDPELVLDEEIIGGSVYFDNLDALDEFFDEEAWRE